MLTGPTTSGKSEAALSLAEALETEIINADSLQVYRYFDIGTAKPGPEARERVRHHLIDILEPDEEFSAFDFKTRALEIARNLQKQNRIPIICGGTGLYLRVLTQDLDCAVQISPEIKEQVQTDLTRLGPQALHARLQRIDPESARKIQPTDPVRIERALSVFLQTGQKLSGFHADDDSALPFPVHTFLIERDRKELYANIDRRVNRMIERGWIGEVRGLLDRGWPPHLKPFQSIGYAQVVRHLNEGLPLDRAVYEIQRETRHYAKRQITWFKKVPDAIPVPASDTDSPGTIRDRILSLLPQAVSFFFCLAASILLNGPAEATPAEDFARGMESLRSKNLAGAETVFGPLIRDHTESLEARRARYLLGRIHLEKNEYSQAIERLKDSIGESADIEDYIRFDLARAYQATGQLAEALEQVDDLLRRFPQSLVRPQAERLRADALDGLGRSREAVALLDQAVAGISWTSPNGFAAYLPRMISRLAQLHLKNGDRSRAYSRLKELYIDYPAHELTQAAIPVMEMLRQRADTGAIPLTLDEHSRRVQGLLDEVKPEGAVREIEALFKEQPVLPGKFYFYLASAHKTLKRRDLANGALETFLKLYPEHARVQEARVQIGRNLWNMGQDQAAINLFTLAIRDNAGTRWGMLGRFLLGRLYEEKNQFELAIQQYSSLTEKNLDDEEAEWAAWRLGWVYYLNENHPRAFEAFKSNFEAKSSGRFAEHNLYWSAKVAEKLGQSQVALQTYAEVFERYPYTYYGTRALQKLQARNPPPAILKKISLPAANIPAEAAPGLNRELTAEERFHYARAVELSALGLFSNAQDEINRLEKTVRKNLTGVIWLSYLYNQARGYSETVRLLQLYLDFTPKEKEKLLSPQFWKFFYPLAYEEIIRETARNQQIDPSFVRGLIRQESLFDSQSLSPAGARGLMQIMPSTGKRLYDQNRNGKPFEIESLFEPNLNIQLGIQYLGQLTRRYGTNQPHVLISYNAGPQVLNKWLKRFQNLDDQDVFIESIPYPETRLYVKKVLRNYNIYKILYPQS